MRPVDELPYVEWQPESGGTERIYADAWENEDLSATATVTVHAVESGSKVSDHYQPEPKKIKIKLFFSGSPVRGDLDPSNAGVSSQVRLDIPPYPDGPGLLSPRGLTTAVEGLVAQGAQALGLAGPSKPDVPDTATVMTFTAPTDRSQAVFQQMTDLQASRTLLTVSTTFGTFDNLAILEVHASRAPDDGDSGSVELDLQQIQFATTDVALALPLPTEPRAQKPKDANSGGGETPTGPKQTAARKLVAELLVVT